MMKLRHEIHAEVNLEVFIEYLMLRTILGAVVGLKIFTLEVVTREVP